MTPTLLNIKTILLVGINKGFYALIIDLVSLGNNVKVKMQFKFF